MGTNSPLLMSHKFLAIRIKITSICIFLTERVAYSETSLQKDIANLELSEIPKIQ